MRGMRINKTLVNMPRTSGRESLARHVIAHLAPNAARPELYEGLFAQRSMQTKDRTRLRTTRSVLKVPRDARGSSKRALVASL